MTNFLVVHQAVDDIVYYQAIAVADLLFLIYITIYNGCVCAGLTDYPVEVSRKSMAYFLRLDLNRARDLHFNNKVHTTPMCIHSLSLAAIFRN